MFNLAEQIKRILADKEITAYRLSRKSGIAESHLSRILSGKQKPTTDTFFAIISGLDMEPADFFLYPQNIERGEVKKVEVKPPDRYVLLIKSKKIPPKLKRLVIKQIDTLLELYDGDT